MPFRPMLQLNQERAPLRAALPLSDPGQNTLGVHPRAVPVGAAQPDRLLYGLLLGDIFPTVITNMIGVSFATYYCALHAWAADSAARRTEAYTSFALAVLVIG